MKKYDLYLFDFDGTLIDSMPALEYVFSYSYNKVGIKFNKDDTVLYSRIPLIDGYERLNGDPSKWQEFVDIIEDSLDHEESINANSVYPETYKFITHLREQHLNAAVVTSNKDSHVKDVLHKMNIPLDTFKLYLGSGQCRLVKPNPAPILMAIDLLNYKGDYKNIVYVGDAINDTLAANNAGVDAVLIDRIDAFPDSDKYIRVHSLMDLFK